MVGFKASDLYATMNISAFFPLTCFLAYYYFCMRSTLKECESSVMNEASAAMKKFFLFLLIAFVAKVIYSALYGAYKTLIC